MKILLAAGFADRGMDELAALGKLFLVIFFLVIAYLLMKRLIKR